MSAFGIGLSAGGGSFSSFPFASSFSGALRSVPRVGEQVLLGHVASDGGVAVWRLTSQQDEGAEPAGGARLSRVCSGDAGAPGVPATASRVRGYNESSMPLSLDWDNRLGGTAGSVRACSPASSLPLLCRSAYSLSER